MIARITQLVSLFDASELVRDQIAAILILESASQVARAAAAGQDSTLWALRVFTELANPIGAFQNPPSGDGDEPTFDLTPIVNIRYAGETFDKGMGDVFERQQGPALFNIDCYGCGISQRQGTTGHIPGDMAAAMASHRASAMVRKLLMAATYAYLRLQTPNQGPVAGRWIQSITPFTPQLDERAVQHVEACRVVLAVDVVELSPQVVGQTLQAVGITITRQANGQVLLTADIPPA